jgi:hypothetical protein
LKFIYTLLLFVCPVLASSQQALPYLTKENKYRFVNDSLQFVTNRQYDWVYMHSTLGYWNVRRGDTSVVVAPDGKEVFKTNHRIESIYFYNDNLYARTWHQPNFGLVDIKNGKQIPEVWDEIYHYQGGDPVVVKKNNKLGIRTLDNKELIPASHDYLRLFQRKFALFYQDKRPVIVQVFSGDTLPISCPEPVQQPEFAEHWIRFKGKQKYYVSSSSGLEQKRQMIPGEKIIYWYSDRILVIDNGRPALYDTTHRLLAQYPVILMPPYQYKVVNKALLFNNGKNSLYLNLSGLTDSIPLPLDQLWDDGGGDFIWSNSDPPGYHYTLSDNRVVLKEYEKTTVLKNEIIRLRGTHFTIQDAKNNIVFTADSIRYFNTPDSVFVDLDGDNFKITCNLATNRMLRFSDGYTVTLKAGTGHYCRYNNKDLYLFYDEGFREVKRLQTDVQPRIFGRFICETRNKKVYLSDFLSGQSLHLELPDNNTVINNDLPYIIVFDTYNYYINRNGVVLKADKSL